MCVDLKEGTTPLVRGRESASSSAPGGYVFLSVTQLMAMTMCAFVMGALIPIAVRFNSNRNAGIEHVTPIGIFTPTSTQQLFNNLRQSSKTGIHQGPKIAWLMSFPNSGTSFTLDLVTAASNMSMATNYANENSDADSSWSAVPVIPDTQGPFWLTPGKTHPTSVVLTKTRCGGFCHDCKVLGSIETPHSFMFHCARAEADIVTVEGNTTNKTLQRYVYDYNEVDRAVHLFRDPLENMVSRFRLAVNELLNKETNATLIERYSSDAQGFERFCWDITLFHDEHHDSRVDKRALELIRDVPCHYDLFRYIQWHNLAFVTTNDNLNLPTHVMYYEDFGTDMEGTLQSLLEFLDLPNTGAKVPFQTGKSYRSYYTEDQISRMRTVSMMLASPLTWHYMERYF